MTALAHPNPSAAAPAPSRSSFSRYGREISVAIAYVLLLACLAIRTPQFFRHQFFTTWVDAAPILLAAIGMTLVILARQIDISIGSMFAVCAVLSGLLAKAGLPMPCVALLTVLAGAALGAINGGLIAGLGLPSIVVTLATLVVFRQSLMWVRQGQFVNDLPHGFQWFGLSQRAGEWMLLAISGVVFTVFAWAMRWLSAGRMVYAVGSSPEAARLAGIRPRRVVFAVFMLMGALVGLAALLNAVRSPDVDPKIGTGWELTVIAAVVVGGAAITGGRATLLGTFIGVALLATIAPALVFFNVPSQWEKAIQGLIILAAVATDGLRRRGN
ncbi:MAG TPA: ABC transporter permease [Tepidisphaeraceae bacterium]|nr:ABC transporter permease [Tepidisphaeraceae bacterium]